MMPGGGSGGTGTMHHGGQWMIPWPGGSGMMNPGHGGPGIGGPGMIGGRIAMTGSTGMTTDGMHLSGSTTRTSGTAGLMMFACTRLNGSQLALK